MPKNLNDAPVNTVRRSDRAVDDESWIRAFLDRAAVASLATVHEGQPFINTNLFYYDAGAHCIYIHTGRYGRTRANIEGDDRACLSIMQMGRLLPADEALEFSVEYAGVTVFGSVRVVEDANEAKRALQWLLDKYAPHLKPGQDYRPPVDEELKRTSVFRLDIEAWSGKRKTVDDDFPGAFWYQPAGDDSTG